MSMKNPKRSLSGRNVRALSCLSSGHAFNVRVYQPRRAAQAAHAGLTPASPYRGER
jgi:hypothetical protein